MEEERKNPWRINEPAMVLRFTVSFFCLVFSLELLLPLFYIYLIIMTRGEGEMGRLREEQKELRSELRRRRPACCSGLRFFLFGMKSFRADAKICLPSPSWRAVVDDDAMRIISTEGDRVSF